MRVLLGATSGVYKNGETIGTILAYNHSGTETIPPRPVLRIAAENTINKNQKLIKAYLDNLVQYAIHRPQDIPKIDHNLLTSLGSQSVAEAKRIILSGDQLQENAPATLARKKGTKPLYVDGTLMENLSYEVEK